MRRALHGMWLGLVIGTSAIVGIAATSDAKAARTSIGQDQAMVATRSGKTLSHTKGRFIVKFKPSLTQCAHCLLHEHQQFSSALTDHSTSLDRLNAEVRVKAIHHLFVDHDTRSVADVHATQVRQLHAKSGRRGKKALTGQAPDLSNVYMYDIPEDADIDAVCQQFATDPHVEYAQPDYTIVATLVPNDPYFNSSGSWGQSYDDLWGLKKIQAVPAWDVTQGQGVVVGVVDSGLDYTHPDIAANVWTNPREIAGNKIDDDGNGFVDDVRGWNFAGNNNDPKDGNGHGTHVSGTIAAVGNNNLGIIGVAPQAKIMPVKALDDNGSGSSTSLAQAILYAAKNGADVISNSWGCGSPCPSNPVVEDAVRTAYNLGAVVVFAAGNSADDVSKYSPTNMTNPKPIVVAASDQLDQPTSFTNFGATVDVTAPGGGTNISPPASPVNNILSLKSSACTICTSAPNLVIGGNYLRIAGTSMATPHVSGAAALIIAKQPSITNEEVRQLLRNSADDVGPVGFDPKTGAGRINLFKALTTNGTLQVKITSPAVGVELSSVKGTVTITGTVKGTNLKEYTLSYSRASTPTTWVPIGGPAVIPVDNGTLGVWNPSGLADDFYTLRVVGMTQTGGKFEDTVQVIVLKYIATPLTTNTATQATPSIFGDKVAWSDFRNNKADVFLYDLTAKTERQLTTATNVEPRYPIIAGSRVVWRESLSASNNDRLVLHELASNTQRILDNVTSAKLDLAFADDKVVWTDWRNSSTTGQDVYLYDLTSNTERRLTTDPANQQQPSVSGNRVVWTDQRNGNMEIYLYDLTSNTERRLTTDPASDENPAISGDRVIWLRRRSGGDDLYLYDLTTNTERRLTTSDSFKYTPKISGSRVVWADQRQSQMDIYTLDLTNGTEQRLTWNPAVQQNPAVSGGRVVWEDQRAGNFDIDVLALNNPPVLNSIGSKTVAAGQPLTFAIAGSDPDGDVLTFSAGSLPTGAVFNPTARTFTWTPTANQAGTYAIVFTVSDGQAQQSETVPVTVTAPDLSMVSISGPTSAVRGTTILMSYALKNQGTAPSGGCTLSLYLSSDATITTGDTFLGSVSIGSLTPGSSTQGSGNLLVPAALPTGTYVLGAVVDSSGVVNESNEANNALAGNTIAVSDGGSDTTPPAVAITTPAAGATVPASGFAFSGTATDASGVKEIHIYVYDNARSLYTVADALASYDPATSTWTFPVLSSHITPGQAVRLWVLAVDINNNVSAWQSRDVTVAGSADTAPPSVVISAPAAGATVPWTGFAFSGTATDASGVKEVRIYVYDIARNTFTVSNALASYTASTGGWSFSVLSSHVTPGTTARLWVQATDTKGNFSAWQSRDVVISATGLDTQAPSVAIMQPATGTILPASGFTFAGTATDASGVSEVRVFVYDYGRQFYTVSNALATYNASAGTWSFQVLASHVTAGADARLWVKATDTKGNTSNWRYRQLPVR